MNKVNSERKLELMRLRPHIRYGDKLIIAELSGFHLKHVVGVLNGRIPGNKSIDLILRVTRMLVENRAELYERVEREVKGMEN